MTLQMLLGENNAAANNQWWMYLVLIGLVVIMLVFPLFTQRKRTKEFNSMLDSMKVGDKVRTIGGVIGRVTKINLDADVPTVVIETGAKGQKTSMEFDVTAIQYNFNYNPQAVTYTKQGKKEDEAKTEAKDEQKPEEIKTEESTEEKVDEKVEEKAEEKEEKPAEKKAEKKTAKKPAAKKSKKK